MEKLMNAISPVGYGHREPPSESFRGAEDPASTDQSKEATTPQGLPVANKVRHRQNDSGYAHSYSPGQTPLQEIPGAFPVSLQPTPMNEKTAGPSEIQLDSISPQKSHLVYTEYFPEGPTGQSTVIESVTPRYVDPFVASNLLHPDAHTDDASTASIKSGVVGREPKSKLMAPDISAGPSLGELAGSIDNIPREDPLSPSSRYLNESNSYTMRSFPLSGSHPGQKPGQLEPLCSTPESTNKSCQEPGAELSDKGFSSTLDDPQYQQFDHGTVLAGSTAAAGVSAYQGLPNTESGTGRHHSNVGNASDPSVHPQPKQMKNHGWKDTRTRSASHTAGPYQSNLANVLDSGVLQDPSKQKEHTAQNWGGQHPIRDAITFEGAAALAGAHGPKTWRGEADQSQLSAERFSRNYDTKYTDPVVVAPKNGLASAASRAMLQPPNSFNGKRNNQHGISMADQRAKPTNATQIGRPVDLKALQNENKVRYPSYGATDAGGTVAVSAEAYKNRQEEDFCPSHGIAKVVGRVSAAAAAYEYHKREAEKAEEKMREREKVREKQMKRLHKEHEKDQSIEQKKYETEVARRDAYRERGVKRDHEKRGGLLGFLHKDKGKGKGSELEDGRRTAGAGINIGATTIIDAALQHERSKSDPSSPTSSGNKESPRRRSGVLGIFHHRRKSQTSDEIVHEKPEIEEANIHTGVTTTNASGTGSIYGKSSRNKLHKGPPPGYSQHHMHQQSDVDNGEERRINESIGTEESGTSDSKDHSYLGLHPNANINRIEHENNDLANEESQGGWKNSKKASFAY